MQKDESQKSLKYIYIVIYLRIVVQIHRDGSVLALPIICGLDSPRGIAFNTFNTYDLFVSNMGQTVRKSAFVVHDRRYF